MRIRSTFIAVLLLPLGAVNSHAQSGGASSSGSAGAASGTGGAAGTATAPGTGVAGPNPTNPALPGNPNVPPVNTANPPGPARQPVPGVPNAPRTGAMQPGSPEQSSSGAPALGNTSLGNLGTRIPGGAAGGGIDPNQASGVTPQQRAEIERAIERDHPPHSSGPNLVGLAVPARTAMRDLPAAVTSIIPAYKAHKYYMVGRDLIVVEPEARQVVDVIRFNQKNSRK